MKTLKFVHSLVLPILSSQKNSTWRINDDKDIVVDDELSLIHIDGTEFARAKVTNVKLTTFAKLSAADRADHKFFKNDDEMYEMFSQFYSMDVGPETPVKVIKFELI